MGTQATGRDIYLEIAIKGTMKRDSYLEITNRELRRNYQKS